ncbi:hypothetical protein PVAND_015414 [Polypedilum vanderplanki]|uniref:Uncharacterized protein n=1 Tax=Polypedilum vanderplanki TaxID=319348 RepID=A0A9J6BCK2_POLVA|nr:hypothetical protein PVAND_015414 [Polypedilum vanderplanki]
MKNDKTSNLLGFIYPRNQLLLKFLNNLIKKLNPSGILNHLIDYGFWLRYRPPPTEIEDPKRVLSMKDLEFYFVIWLPCCLASFVVFIFEIRSLWIRR